MRKYNLALTPISKANDIVDYAKKLAKIADTYLLGEKSFPHVTLYQFEVEGNEIPAIWERIEKLWKHEPIALAFKQFSCLSYDNNVTFWPSLLPDNCDRLHGMHCLIAEVLGKPVKMNFDPHMTLLNTKNRDFAKYMEMLKSSYEPISDKFILTLGDCDQSGQLTKVIFSYEN